MRLVQLVSLPVASILSLAVSPALAATTPSPRFNGLSDGSGTFTSSPNRCAISILYDAMRAEWKDGPPKKMPEVHFTLVGNLAAAGRPVTLDMRGMASFNGGPHPVLQLTVGSSQRTLALGQGEFRLHTISQLARHGDSTPVKLRLTLSELAGVGASGLAMLDAIDLTLEGCR